MSKGIPGNRRVRVTMITAFAAILVVILIVSGGYVGPGAWRAFGLNPAVLKNKIVAFPVRCDPTIRRFCQNISKGIVKTLRLDKVSDTDQ